MKPNYIEEKGEGVHGMFSSVHLDKKDNTIRKNWFQQASELAASDDLRLISR